MPAAICCAFSPGDLSFALALARSLALFLGLSLFLPLPLSFQTTWEKIKRQDAEAAEAAYTLRIKEREFHREKQFEQEQRDYYEKTQQTQDGLSKRIAQMRMKSTPQTAVEASVSVKTKQAVEDSSQEKEVVDFHSQDPLVIFLDNKAKNKSLIDRLQEERGVQSLTSRRVEQPSAQELQELGQ